MGDVSRGLFSRIRHVPRPVHGADDALGLRGSNQVFHPVPPVWMLAHGRDGRAISLRAYRTLAGRPIDPAGDDLNARHFSCFHSHGHGHQQLGANRRRGPVNTRGPKATCVSRRASFSRSIGKPTSDSSFRRPLRSTTMASSSGSRPDRGRATLL